MTFSRRVEDYIIVTLITLLIWFYAESRTLEQYAPTKVATVPVQIRSANRDIMIVSPSVVRISDLEFTGSRAAIGRLQAALMGGLTLHVDLNEPGTRTLSLRQLISDQFRDINASLTRIEPATVEVMAVRKVRREVELRFRADEVTLQDDPHIEPATAQVRLPEDRLSEIMVDGKPVLYLRPSRESERDLRRLPVNQEQKIRARVELPAALQGHPEVEIEPTEVTVSFIIEKKEDTHVLSAVPVFVSSPPSEWANFRVTLHDEDRLLKDVKVTGPVELVDRVRSGEVTLIAQPVLTRDELVRAAERDEVMVPVMFLTQPPVTGLVIESPRNSVRARVVRPEP